MSIVIHRIDAPLVTCSVVMCMENAVKERIAEKHVRMCHVYLCTKHTLSFSIFSITHAAEKLEVFFYAAVSVRTLCTRLLDCTSTCTDFLLCLIIYICKPLLDQFLSPIIELIEIV